MANLGKLQVAIGADTSEFDSAMGRTEGRMSQFATRARAVVRAGAAIGAAATAAGAAIVTRFTAAQFKAIDAQAKLAQSLHTTTASMATLERAGDLAGVSMQGIEQFTKDLTRRLSQAAEGAGPAADALDRLGLSANDLMGMPLDQRVATINRAIRDFVPAAEQAAVAGRLFGEEGSIAASRLSPETIAEAAKQAEAFGLAVSDVDAAQIERANDAMSTISAVLQGVFRRIAVQVAPAVEHLANMFQSTAMETRGFEDQIGRTMTFAGRAVGFVADGINGLSVGFKGAMVAGNAFRAGMLAIANAVAGSFNTVIQGIVDRVRSTVEMINRLPGPDIPLDGLDAVSSGFEESRQQMAAWSQQARDDLAGSLQAFHEAAMQPVPSDMIAQFFEEARAASAAAAEQIVADRQSMLGIGESGLLELEKIKDINAQKEEEEKRHADRVAEIKAALGNKQVDLTRTSKDQELSETKNANQQMIQAGAQAAQELFGQNKTARVAIATVNGISSAVAAWEKGMQSGGPKLAAAYTALSLARTGAMISSLKSAGYSGGGGGAVAGAAAGGITQGSGAPEQRSEQSQARSATINLSGDVFSREGVMALIDQVDELMADGYGGVTVA